MAPLERRDRHHHDVDQDEKHGGRNQHHEYRDQGRADPGLSQMSFFERCGDFRFISIVHERAPGGIRNVGQYIGELQLAGANKKRAIQLRIAGARQPPCIIGAMHRALLAFAAAAALLASASSLAQQDYPNRPIRLVNTSAAGGTGDTLARAVSRLVEKDLNTTIVVDNRPGATGMIAVESVVRAEPNGYTLVQTSSSIVTNAATGRKLPYDVTKDIIPVANLATAEGYLVLVNSALRVSTVSELVALAKGKNLLYGTPGPGNPIHFMTEALSRHAGIAMTHVPYKGLAPAIIALISGEIHVLLAPPIATRQHIASGKMRAVASVGAKRVSSMPDVPTMEEAGYKGLTLLGGWQGWFAPAKTPHAIVSRLNAAVVKAVNSDELRGLMQGGGYVPDTKSAGEFRALVLADYRRFSELAKAANIREE